MNCSLSGEISRYLDVLYETYDSFDVQQTTVEVTPEELAALDEQPEGIAIRARIEGEAGVVALPDGNEWALPAVVAETPPTPETVETLLERRTGVQCTIESLERVSIVCLQSVDDAEVWTLSLLFSATAVSGSPRNSAVWRESPVRFPSPSPLS